MNYFIEYRFHGGIKCFHNVTADTPIDALINANAMQDKMTLINKTEYPPKNQAVEIIIVRNSHLTMF